ncbi:MAG: hypothetical protein LBT02_03575 [Rickettsiales bacterium]|jgi:uncharacterized pyridoxamine 5'-phosphate oxidase family protein|nr:hypothetical protein [Rickettsiales bacterium]
MDKVLNFLKESKIFYVATIDNDVPRVRPFGVALSIDGKLSICTGSFKDVYKQIMINKNIEISSTLSNGNFIRISGKVFDNSKSQNKEKFFTEFPRLKNIYKDKEEEFAVLTFEKASVKIITMSDNGTDEFYV